MSDDIFLPLCICGPRNPFSSLLKTTKKPPKKTKKQKQTSPFAQANPDEFS